jgi:hypothetical protein
MGSSEGLEFEKAEDQAKIVSCKLSSFVSGRVDSGDKKAQTKKQVGH